MKRVGIKDTKFNFSFVNRFHFEIPFCLIVKFNEVQFKNEA